MKYIIPYLIGIFFSVIIGNIIVRCTIKELWHALGDDDVSSPDWRIVAQTQGFIERLLYTLAWHFGHPSFIAAWLVLKVASKWKRYEEEPGYNVFLVGSGISILYAIVGALVINWIKAMSWLALLIPAILLECSLLVLLWLKWKTRNIAKAA